MLPGQVSSEQAASPMEAMLQLMMQKFEGVANAVERMDDRIVAIESRDPDVSQPGSGDESSTGRGSTSAETMVATSVDWWEWAPEMKGNH
jgi:hypothetical protein